MPTPCEMHELTNCATCSGAEARFHATLESPALDSTEPVPFIPGGVTIRARFPGRCASCATGYDRNALIHRAHGENDEGWIGVECCAR